MFRVAHFKFTYCQSYNSVVTTTIKFSFLCVKFVGYNLKIPHTAKFFF